jgi:hypothetical protein
MMSMEYLASRVQVTREGKQDCLYTVRQLVELAFAARDQGLLAMEKLIDDRARFPDPFLRTAVQLVIDTSNQNNIRRVLYNYIHTTAAYKANHKFLEGIIITEAMLAISAGEDLDYLFIYLLPSYFGLEYADAVTDVYHGFKRELVRDAVEQNP